MVGSSQDFQSISIFSFLYEDVVTPLKLIERLESHQLIPSPFKQKIILVPQFILCYM